MSLPIGLMKKFIIKMLYGLCALWLIGFAIVLYEINYNMNFYWHMGDHVITEIVLILALATFLVYEGIRRN